MALRSHRPRSLRACGVLKSNAQSSPSDVKNRYGVYGALSYTVHLSRPSTPPRITGTHPHPSVSLAKSQKRRLCFLECAITLGKSSRSSVALCATTKYLSHAHGSPGLRMKIWTADRTHPVTRTAASAPSSTRLLAIVPDLLRPDAFSKHVFLFPSLFSSLFHLLAVCMYLERK
ncbi:uncharacterized protein FOMMEDRAFT_161762 [Fomitiporia mediterranea MF3/22]|uniref:uncharacterized protein n=1 Tax=Fomitiporia mediterranea (strain MF3/22) TaxID=694068 RepID=UPI0004408B01|nr:uncharacterized protein FOMMEDRAFT_161762 [Fomitiporia mediterranea MF3/22]EJC98385.1 hypothetical protein FOMMEDRAFT_161762 [Fomitiporia mediterranea MF3/22]